MENEVVKIRQLLDTKIVGTVQKAFATIKVKFPAVDGKTYEVEFDMEAGLDILFQLDEGKEPVRLIEAMRGDFFRVDRPMEKRDPEPSVWKRFLSVWG